VDSLTDRLNAALSRRADRGWVQAGQAEAALAALVEAPTVGETAERVGAIAKRFGLDPVETEILSVAALAEASTAAHLLLGLLSGDEAVGRPTVALALELAGTSPDSTAAHLHVGELSRLRRYGLVQLAGNDVMLSRRVALVDRVAAAVADNSLPPAFVFAMLLDTVAVHVDGTTLLADALRGGQQLVWVHAPGGGCGIAMSAAACEELGVPYLVADLARADVSMTAADAARALLLECGLEGMILVLAGAERAPTDVLTQAAVPVIAVSVEPWNPQWSTELPVTVAAPRLTVDERRALWKPVLGATAADREITAMPLSPEQIIAVGRHARMMAELHGEDEITPARIRNSTRQLGRGRSVRANPGASATLDDLVLSGHALEEIRRLLNWARYRDEIVAMGPLHGKGGKGTGICALFSGPPGTGKTLAAHVIADSLGMDLYQVELSGIVDKYIGETEKNLEKVFAEAESLNAVLFFDEADALFGSRSEVRDAKDRYANQEIAYLLQRMEQFDGITVLASNLRGNIDPAFARRLHFIVSFPDPDGPTRRRLWQQHLADIPTDDADPIDLDWLSTTVELAGGDIRNIVLSSAYAAVAEGSSVGMRHISSAVRREYIKLGRRPAVRVDPA
jgi:DNA polymerase III delta prime subunit